MESILDSNSRIFNRRSTFGQQLMALIKRNILIKRRNRGRTLLEFLFPIYMILITISVKSSMKPTTSEAIPHPQGNVTNWFVHRPQLKSFVFPDFRNTEWFIISQNKIISQQIKNNIIDVLKAVSYPDYENIEFNTNFNNSDEIERHYLLNEDNISLALIFDANNSSKISYTIRMPYNSVPNDHNTIGSIGECRNNPFWKGCDQIKYFSSGFAFIQSVVDSALIKFLKAGAPTHDYLIPEASLSVFPIPEFTSDSVKWQSFVPTYLSWCFMPSVSILTIMFVLEKERKIKEGMLMMGLRMSAYWLSWILVQTILILIVSLVMTLILHLTSIIENTNSLILFILISLFGVSTIGISALISPFFKKEKAAGSVVSFITMIAGCVHLLVVFLDVSPSVYYLLSLISPVAFTLGLNSITLQIDRKISFNNMFEGPNFSVGSAILMLIFDCILYSFLAIYLDNVIPGEFGPKQSLFFFLKKSFWFPHKLMTTNGGIRRSDSNYEHNPDVEEIADDMRGKAVISIENLSKIYGKGKKSVKAVNNLSFTVYESQITGLLGHNGAGKSTLINMLVGNIASTSGSAYIYGYNISDTNDMNILRQMFGVCLQQDILFDELSAEEHLNFFAQIKGVANQSVNFEVKELLSKVQLFDDRMTASKKLSGGQKRKLCVAIALIGNPKIIVLDEPSSGVDPYSRRQLWSLLQSYKKDRIIILSTHFMDEADLLADRKAIITNGKLRCVGSSLFLKNRFGIGYHLTVDIKKGTDVNPINHLIQSNIKGAKVERFTSSEVYYILPPTETQEFPKLLDVLEQNISNDKSFIKSFGISMTTLEEVFLKIGDEVEIEEQTNVSKHYVAEEPNPNRYEELITDNQDFNPNFWQTFKAFIYIRLLIFIRNPMHTIPIIVLPIIIIIISYFLMKSSNLKDFKPIPLLLNSEIYSKKSNLLFKNTSLDIKDKFFPLVEKFGVRAQTINNFDLKSMSNSFMAVNIRSFDSNIAWDFLFNDTYYHSLPIVQNLMANVFYYFRNPNPNQSPIQTYNHPFPQTDKENVTFDAKVYTYVILMAIMLGSIPPSIAVEVVEDRESRIKNLLRVCGLGFRGYWITTLVCHLIMFLVSILLVLIGIIFIVKVEFLQDPQAIGCVFILFILFMPTSLITCYVLTHMFDKKDTARSVLPIICYLPGMIMVIFVSVLTPINPNTGRLLHIVFSFLWPFYVPQGALLWMATTSNLIKISSLIPSDNPRISYFDWNQNITICFISLTFQLVLYSVLLVIVDRLKSGETLLSAIGFQGSHSGKVTHPSDLEDDDVRQERVEVQQYLSGELQSKTPIVLLNDLHKKYYNNNVINVLRKNTSKSEKIAVQNMNLMLESGNIFGLLGPNGAGKTTAMKIMICEEKQTEGTVLISGQKVNSSDTEIFKLIGYCPQHDALWKEITLDEHLSLYSSIRGIPPQRIQSVCQNYIESMEIGEHSNKKTHKLSGGTKRKLCYLLALLGRPKLVLLDEPSTGMDPKAKRFLWKTILSAFERNSNRSAVLTTHSMEEADALCTRLAIMIKGVMRCIGSVQHLKNKYGAGYILEIKFNNQTNDEIIESKQTIESYFTKVVVKEEYKNRLIFDIPQQSVDSISRIFSFLENLKQTMASIEEYSFSQKTIEQVFIDFAKQQEISE